MTLNQMVGYCFDKPGAYSDIMSGGQPVSIMVKKTAFAQFYTNPDDPKVTLKSNPAYMTLLRQRYPKIVQKPYGCPEEEKRSWYTLLIDGSVDDDQIKKIMDHAYDTAVQSLGKKAQRELAALEDQTKIPYLN